MIYFDNAATTKVRKEVLNEMFLIMEEDFANIDSNYNISLNFKKKLERSKKILKDRLGLDYECFSFTSGGSEANNLALIGTMRKYKKGHFIISAIEHPSISMCANKLVEEGYELDILPVDIYGNVNIDILENLIREDTKLVSIIGVNNEIGTIQDMKKIGDVIKNKNINTLYHIDFVQGLNHVDYDFSNVKVDLLSISSHKIHGPKGVGALYIKKGLTIKNQTFGENKENKYIPRTFPNELVMGFLKAIELYEIDSLKYLGELKEYFINKLNGLENIRINTPKNSSNSIISVSFEGVKAEVLLNYLANNDIYVSTGSACSGNKRDSEVLKAIKLEKKYLESSIRISFSIYNTFEEIDKFFDVLVPFLNMARNLK